MLTNLLFSQCAGMRVDRFWHDRSHDPLASQSATSLGAVPPVRAIVWLIESAGEPIYLRRLQALVIQIRGAVAEYERAVIADRMRRGRLTALRAGRMLPWSTPPYGYRVDPLQPRDPRRRADRGE